MHKSSLVAVALFALAGQAAAKAKCRKPSKSSSAVSTVESTFYVASTLSAAPASSSVVYTTAQSPVATQPVESSPSPQSTVVATPDVVATSAQPAPLPTTTSADPVVPVVPATTQADVPSTTAVPTPSSVPPPPPPPPSGQGLGYATYHMYTSNESLDTVSCSDGSNGLITRWGYSDLSQLWPYVMAFNDAGWNSPNCGTCIELTDTITGNTVHVTVIDQCGPPPSGYSAHFDIAPPAHQELFGAAASVSKGSGVANYRTVASSFCRGNRG